jgi:hypothetical protein
MSAVGFYVSLIFMQVLFRYIKAAGAHLSKNVSIETTANKGLHSFINKSQSLYQAFLQNEVQSFTHCAHAHAIPGCCESTYN